MTQTPRQSLIESLANTAFGFLISILGTYIIFPLLGMETTFLQNIGSVIGFTIISIARNYIIRRLFNGT